MIFIIKLLKYKEILLKYKFLFNEAPFNSESKLTIKTFIKTIDGGPVIDSVNGNWICASDRWKWVRLT